MEDYWLTFMIHELGKFYGWGKTQLNEVYPEEAPVLLKFIAYEKKDQLLQDKIEYYNRCFDGLYIQHGDPEQQRKRFTAILEKLQNMQITIRHEDEQTTGYNYDDELPDLDKLHRLKQFKYSK